MAIVPNTIHFEIVCSEDIARKLGLDLSKRQPPACGSLSDKQYFATATSRRSQYRLFHTKVEYIAYFFIDNTIQDRRMRPNLLQYKGMPVVDLMNFSRLGAVNTKSDEIVNAVNSKLPHLNVVEIESLGLCICRRDEYYGINATLKELLGRMAK
ncbi:hypothetical protein ACTXT7_015377 [Hymenolepis weldensis]